MGEILPIFPWSDTYEDAIEHQKELERLDRRIKKYAKIFLERDKKNAETNSYAHRAIERRKKELENKEKVSISDNHDFISDVYRSAKNGETDSEIAERWNTHRNTVADVRRLKLGIRYNRVAG